MRSTTSSVRWSLLGGAGAPNFCLSNLLPAHLISESPRSKHFRAWRLEIGTCSAASRLAAGCSGRRRRSPPPRQQFGQVIDQRIAPIIHWPQAGVPSAEGQSVRSSVSPTKTNITTPGRRPNSSKPVSMVTTPRSVNSRASMPASSHTYAHCRRVERPPSPRRGRPARCTGSPTSVWSARPAAATPPRAPVAGCVLVRKISGGEIAPVGRSRVPCSVAFMGRSVGCAIDQGKAGTMPTVKPSKLPRVLSPRHSTKPKLALAVFGRHAPNVVTFPD